MLSQIRPAIVLLVLFTALTGLAYPLAITGIAQVAFPYQANGSLIAGANGPVGSALIGQNFASDKYFHPPPVGDAGAGSRASRRSHQDDRRALQRRQFDGLQSRADFAEAPRPREGRRRRQARRRLDGPIPADAVTTSASGLDPHISPENAYAQVPAVAKARGLAEDKLRALVAANVEGRFLGLIGEPRVNVLRLNLALDALGAAQKSS